MKKQDGRRPLILAWARYVYHFAFLALYQARNPGEAYLSYNMVHKLSCARDRTLVILELVVQQSCAKGS